MTDKKDEALKLALEALEQVTDAFLDTEGNHGQIEVDAIAASYKAITAIKEALAEQPAQQQEPVACAAPMACSGADKCVFRTSPPASKPWIGLTYEDREKLRREADDDDAGYMGVITRTEAKLKEKNNG